MSSAPAPFHLFTSLRYDPLLLQHPDPHQPSHDSHHANTTTTTTTTTAPRPPTGFYMPLYHRDRLLEAATHFHWPHAVALLRGADGYERFMGKLREAVAQGDGDGNGNGEDGDGGEVSPGPLRVKVVVHEDGSVSIETGPTPAVSIDNLYPSQLPPPRNTASTAGAGAGAGAMKISPLTGGALQLGASDSLPGTPPRPSAAPYILSPARTPVTPSAHTRFKTTARAVYDAARAEAGIASLTARKEVLMVAEGEAGEITEGSIASVYLWRGGRWVTPRVERGGQQGTTRRWALERGVCVEGSVGGVGGLGEGEEGWVSSGVRGFQWGVVRL